MVFKKLKFSYLTLTLTLTLGLAPPVIYQPPTAQPKAGDLITGAVTRKRPQSNLASGMDKDLAIKNPASQNRETLLKPPQKYGASLREIQKIQKLQQNRDTAAAIQKAGGNIQNLRNMLEQEKARQSKAQPLVLKGPTQADLTLQRERLKRAEEIKNAGSLQNEQRRDVIQSTQRIVDEETKKVRADELKEYLKNGMVHFNNVE